MSISSTTINGAGRTQRGSVALAALVALVIVFIIALGLLVLGGNARLSGRRTMRLNGAQALASAGIEYGYWQRVYNGQALPYTNTRTLGSGSFTVTVTDNSATTAGTIQIVSTGTQSRDKVTLTRILAAPASPFNYALCSGGDLNINQIVTTGASSANGDVNANGNIALNKNGTVVNGDATATKAIGVKSITGTKTPNGPGVTFPALTASYYQGIATFTYTGNQAFSGAFALPPPSGGFYPVIVINGNLTIGTGTITGIGTVFVTGNVTITGNFSYLYATDKLAVLCLGNIINGAVAGTSINSIGYFYAHNSTGTATFQDSNTATMTINGGMAADAFSVTGPLTATHDPAMNGTLGSKMRLPGY